LPARDSIIGITIIRRDAAVAAGGPAQPVIRIFHTNEIDEYEKGARSAAAAAAAAKNLPTGDNFLGTDRKVAKLSIAKAQTEVFADVQALIATLPTESAMINHKPPIRIGPTVDRVKEEMRNVRVQGFIYAASREADNDFHLIVGRDPQSTPEMYMTMELSGLPSASAASFSLIKTARDTFKQYFKDTLQDTLPGMAYDFYDPPLALAIEGSLFFDITHANGPSPGPKSLKSRMPVIWEVHPITKMVFNSLTGKRRKTARPRKKKEPSVGTGLPSADSITGVQEIRVGNKVQRIIHTSELDEYEKPQTRRNKEKSRRK
jgi:hypothetical protein